MKDIKEMKYFIKLKSEYRILIEAESIKQAKDIVSNLYIEDGLMDYVNDYDKNRWINIDFGWEIVDSSCKRVKEAK